MSVCAHPWHKGGTREGYPEPACPRCGRSNGLIREHPSDILALPSIGDAHEAAALYAKHAAVSSARSGRERLRDAFLAGVGWREMVHIGGVRHVEPSPPGPED